MMIKIILKLVYFSFFSIIVSAQIDSSKFVTVIPGNEYSAGSLHRLIFGDHWRDIWTEPITVPVLDLQNFAGGLKPYEVGGGKQTRSLKFHGNDGQRWKFRSINKDPSKLLPEALQNTLADDILQDQISSANPFAAVIVSELLKAVDILQAIPIIVVLPDDPALGEFREEFAGMLGTIEVHPDEADAEDIVEFYDTDKIKGTFKLFETVEDKRNDKVKPDEFVKARLMDVFIGDWDRHADQWRWAKMEVNDWDYWLPIPRDRDQAFAKFDGIAPSIVAYLVPQLAGFGYGYPQIEDLTWNGRHIDRRFLTELSESKWDSVTTYLQTKLSDSVIVQAVKKLPEAQFNLAGDELISKLKFRRDNLHKVTKEYYRLVNQVADIYGTNKDDFVLVNRIDNSKTSVSIFNLDKSEQKPKGEPYFSKIFENEITDEIRIHMLDDDDYVLVKGEVDSGPLVRVVGGKGKDTFVDSSKVKGYFLSFTPIPDAENSTRFYDHGDASVFIESAGTEINREKVDEPEDLVLKYEPEQIDRGHNWILLPDAGYTTNDGVMLGANLSLFSYNFRKSPYEYLQRLSFLYAFLPESYRIDYFGEFIDALGDFDVILEMTKSELQFTNYFGFGNETTYSENLFDAGYYRLGEELISINPKLRFNFNDHVSFSIGLIYEFNKSSLSNADLIENFRYGTFGIGEIQNFGLTSHFLIDTRDNEFYPFTGTYLKAGGRYYGDLLDSKDEYFRGEFDLRHFLSFDFPSHSTIALKASGGKIWGKYPFFHAIFLGGEDNLRAYTRGRFSGDAAIAFQSALRTKLFEPNIIVKGDFGISLFAETGRVFTANLSSKKWHPSFGGGIWTSYLDRELVFAFTYAYSTDEQNIYFDMRMGF